MYHLNRTMLAGVAVLSLGLCTLMSANADESKPKPASTALDMPKLAQMLDDMGYETKKINDTTYDVILKRDNWNIYVRLYFSTDGTKLWLNSHLTNIDDMSKVPTEILVKLMEANGPVDNRNISAKQLRVEIDAQATIIRSTQNLWKPEEWRKSTPAANDNSVRQETKVTQ